MFLFKLRVGNVGAGDDPPTATGYKEPRASAFVPDEGASWHRALKQGCSWHRSGRELSHPLHRPPPSPPPDWRRGRGGGALPYGRGERRGRGRAPAGVGVCPSEYGEWTPACAPSILRGQERPRGVCGGRGGRRVWDGAIPQVIRCVHTLRNAGGVLNAFPGKEGSRKMNLTSDPNPFNQVLVIWKKEEQPGNWRERITNWESQGPGLGLANRITAQQIFDQG
ncbi:uncharacterized protein LOC101031440 [Saimiri boliviensis]|uniref:uncharacterized protein LOC101031440 n=1 Tax=Saimiri boliviensis TaxID=27679 RepID=UPI003D7796F2